MAEATLLAYEVQRAGAYLSAVADLRGQITVIVSPVDPMFTVFIGADMATAAMGTANDLTRAIVGAIRDGEKL